MKPIRAAVIGCTGLVGQQFVKMLDNHPYFEVQALISSPKSERRKYAEAVHWAVCGDIPQYAAKMDIEDLNIEALKGRDIKLVFSALPATVAREIEGELRQEKMGVFSNASAYRLDDHVPILIPEVNWNHLQLAEDQLSKYRGFIVTTSNCSTAGLVLALKPILSFGVRSVFVSTYQAISGAGRGGVSGMEISGNVLPFIKNEEEKMEREVKKILGILQGGCIQDYSIDIHASCCRVPVREGHLESVVVELGKDPDLEELKASWSKFSGIPQELQLPTSPEHPVLLRNELDRPQPILDSYAGNPPRAKGMAVSIGRVSKRFKRIRFFLLVHNTIRGAAGNCILNAELAAEKGLIQYKIK